MRSPGPVTSTSTVWPAAIGAEHIAEFLSPFGYGALTGIDISGEKPGLLPSPEWKRKAFKRPQDQVWFPGETVNFGVGQGYLLVTPLQLAHVASVLAGARQELPAAAGHRRA
jgi:penicillin-binding protein 2